MKVMISIVKGSPIDTLWRRHCRSGGEVEGLIFALKNDIFVADDAPLPGALDRLTYNPSVRVEMIGTVELAPAVVAVDAAVTVNAAPPAPAAAPPPPPADPAPVKRGRGRPKGSGRKR